MFIISAYIFLLQVEKLDENEWWNKLQQLKQSGQKELVVKRNFGRDGQNILADMAHELGLHLYALLFYLLSFFLYREVLKPINMLSYIV